LHGENIDGENIDGENIDGENIDITASNKPVLLSVYKKIVTVVEAQFESVSDIKSQSRELRRQRISTYYRFKRWEKVNR
jgi:hypothetical protein